jgi:hypothetical protein
MRSGSGSVVQWYTPWPGVRGITILAPGTVPMEPGQYALCAPREATLNLLPRVCLPISARQAGALDCLMVDGDEARHWCSLQGVVDGLSVTAPLGRPYVLDSKVRRALLIDGCLPQAPLLSLVQRLVDRGVEIAYLACPESGGVSLPVSALPPEIEYLQAGPAADGERFAPFTARLETLALWPDAIYAAIGREYFSPMLAVLRRRLLHLRKGFAQVLVMPPALPCGVGACDVCGLQTRQGWRRVCRDGLVFDLLAFA